MRTRISVTFAGTAAILLLLALVTGGCGGDSASLPIEQGNVVVYWNDVAVKTAAAEKHMTPQIARELAIAQIAVYDAVNAIENNGQFYNTGIPLNPLASKEAAVAQAAYQTLVGLFPAQKASLDAELAKSMKGILNGPEKSAGIVVGNQAAQGILARRAGDGSAGGMGAPYTGGTDPGQWRPTPPGNLPGMFYSWRMVSPFAMTSQQQFRPAAPPALTSAEYAADFNECKAIGSKTSATRTAAQSMAATFWVGMPGSVMEAGRMNQAAQQAAIANRLTVHQTARLFALVNMAISDAVVAGLDCKYAYSAWRPITAIREAAADGNPATDADAAWLPFLETPAHPEYISTHSAITKAGATVLERFFGTDTASITLAGFMDPRVTKRYTSFSQISDDASTSRIYGGIHFRFSCETGKAMGQQIGEYAWNNYLRPL